MKNNMGFGIIKIIILMIIIALIVFSGVYFARMKYHESKLQTVKTDMLQVQWKVKSYVDKQTVKGEEDKYLGTKISEIEDDELINEFLKENVLQEDEYDKFYVLKDEDMQKAELQITNYEGSYFLVNYDDYEIVVTKGFEYNKDEKLYKLSEIEKKTESKEQEQNQEQNPNQENTEIDTNTETKEEE